MAQMNGHRPAYRLMRRVIPRPLFQWVSSFLSDGVKRRLVRLMGSRWLAGPEWLLVRVSPITGRRGRPPVTRQQLITDLEACQFPEQCVVFVHSSLSALGYVVNGPQAAMEALKTVVVDRRDGTLAMPAFSLGRGSMYDSLQSGEVVDLRTAPSAMGAITEAFRRLPGVCRSVHPTHSVAALGPRAAWLVAGHENCGTTFGDGSPFAKLLEADAHLLGLGVDLGPVTFYHVLEDRRPDFPVSVYTKDSPLPSVCRDGGGRERRLSVMAHDPVAARTRIDHPLGTWIRSYITGDLERGRSLRWVSVGAGRAWIIRARDLYAGLEELLERGITIYSTREQVEALVTGLGR